MQDILWRSGHDKKLRIKLIVASMISLFLVLFIIGGIAGVLNYRKIAEDADRILEVLEKNAGHFPKMIPGNEKGGRHGISPEILMNPDIFLFYWMKKERLF